MYQPYYNNKITCETLLRLGYDLFSLAITLEFKLYPTKIRVIYKFMQHKNQKNYRLIIAVRVLDCMNLPVNSLLSTWRQVFATLAAKAVNPFLIYASIIIQ